MIQQASSHWRRGGPGGREPIASACDAPSLANTQLPSSQTWGKVTSRRPMDRRELEYQAFRLGCSVAALREAIARGLFNG